MADIIREDFYYPSADGITTIHACRWMPPENVEPRAVLQIIHGMTEYIARYDNFARFMAKNGFIVSGEDHIGHGESVASPEHYGYFGDNGNEWIIQDIHRLRTEMHSQYPELPYMMLGHSMGSFLVRQYVTEGDASYADGLAGVIVMGTAWQPAIALAGGKAVAKLQGTHKMGVRSKMLEAMAFGTYLKRIENPESISDWLTKDREIVKEYRSNPLCTFHFTPNAFYHMFRGMEKAHDISRISKLPADLPILFCAGAEDPVGSWGEGVRKAFMVYTENTDCIVDIKLYDDDRHEILNELDKEQVYADMLDYLNSCVEEYNN